MKTLVIGIVAFVATALVGGAGVALWVAGGIPLFLTHEGRKVDPLALRVPGRDKPTGQNTDPPKPMALEFAKGEGKPAPQLAGNWAGFRGAARDAIGDGSDLARTWPAGGPKVLWKRDVGEGHAGPAVLNGRVYLHDYDTEKRRDVIRCMSLEDGRDIWTQAYKVSVKRNHGMSRATPAVTDKFVVSMGPKCHVACLDSNTGAVLWVIDLSREYGTVVPLWYSAQCPLIDGDKAILAPGGRKHHVPDPEGIDPDGLDVYVPKADGTNPKGDAILMMALQCQPSEPGKAPKVAWSVPNDCNWMMTHSSIVKMQMEDGTDTYVYCGSGGVIGVSAEDGKVLWKTEDWRIRTNVPTPVPVAKGKVFLCGGYGAGACMLEIAKKGDQYVPAVTLLLPPTTFGSEQQTPILYKGHLFGVRPDGQMCCLDLGGNVVWASGAKTKFGADGGPFVIADDMIYALDDAGLMRLLKATPASYQQLAEAKVTGHHSLGPMAMAGNRLLCRDLIHLYCLDVGK
jgi:outer membrane protein assembly factor BamB